MSNQSGAWTSHKSITWELLGNAESQAATWTYWSDHILSVNLENQLTQSLSSSIAYFKES